MGCTNSLVEPRPAFSHSRSFDIHAEIQSPQIAHIRIHRSITSVFTPLTDLYRIIKVIGTNKLGATLLAQDLLTGTYRAIREISKSLLSEMLDGYNETRILKGLDHPNVLKYYETIETDKNFYEVFEYLNGGDLRSKIRVNKGEINLSKYIFHVLNALNYIHLNSIVHCNLTPDHILLSEENECVAKITNFHASQRLDNPQLIDLKHLSYAYTSPEILNNEYNEKTDMWSLGVIVYELLVGKFPYVSKEKYEVLSEIYKGEVDFSNPNFLYLSYNAKDFIKKLLRFDRKLRLSAKDALAHPWMRLALKESALNYGAMMKLRTFKINTNIARQILKIVNRRVQLKEHEIISIFTQLDKDKNGYLTREEVIAGFKALEIDVVPEIDTIMNNIDIDKSGVLDFTEVKIALTDWSTEIFENNVLSLLFSSNNGYVFVKELKDVLQNTLPHEWLDFIKKTKSDDEKVAILSLNNYIISSLS